LQPMRNAATRSSSARSRSREGEQNKAASSSSDKDIGFPLKLFRVAARKTALTSLLLSHTRLTECPAPGPALHTGASTMVAPHGFGRHGWTSRELRTEGSQSTPTNLCLQSSGPLQAEAHLTRPLYFKELQVAASRQSDSQYSYAHFATHGNDLLSIVYKALPQGGRTQSYLAPSISPKNHGQRSSQTVSANWNTKPPPVISSRPVISFGG
jgi:hypothetical protein